MSILSSDRRGLRLARAQPREHTRVSIIFLSLSLSLSLHPPRCFLVGGSDEVRRRLVAGAAPSPPPQPPCCAPGLCASSNHTRQWRRPTPRPWRAPHACVRVVVGPRLHVLLELLLSSPRERETRESARASHQIILRIGRAKKMRSSSLAAPPGTTIITTTSSAWPDSAARHAACTIFARTEEARNHHGESDPDDPVSTHSCNPEP